MMKSGEEFCNNTYGGILYQEDFRTYIEDEQYDDFHSMSNIAERIIRDIRFDEKCKRLAKERDKKIKERKLNDGK